MVPERRSDCVRSRELLRRSRVVHTAGEVHSGAFQPTPQPESPAEICIHVRPNENSRSTRIRVAEITFERKVFAEAVQFEALRADVENTAAVEVTSAVALSAEQQAKLAAALKTRLKRDVVMTTCVDPGLIGGAVIRCGDLVIDGSLQGRLSRLRTELSN